MRARMGANQGNEQYRLDQSVRGGQEGPWESIGKLKHTQIEAARVAEGQLTTWNGQ